MGIRSYIDNIVMYLVIQFYAIKHSSVVSKIRYLFKRNVADMYYVQYDLMIDGYILYNKRTDNIHNVAYYATIAIFSTLDDVERTLANNHNTDIKL